MSGRSLLVVGTAFRAGYGLVSLFAPQILFSSARVPLADDSRYFNALFGGRDLTVAALTVSALRAGREHEAVLINYSCEATDLLALVQELRARGRVDATVAAGIAFNVAGWCAWTLAARGLET